MLRRITLGGFTAAVATGGGGQFGLAGPRAERSQRSATNNRLASPQQLGQLPIVDYFNNAAGTVGGQPRLSMTLDDSNATVARLPSSDLTSAFFLQVALGRLTQNPASGVRKLGLIYGDSWPGHPKVLGMMFDLGFNPIDLDAVQDSHLALPREGCVVFTSAIAQLRAAADIHTETMFTSVHELGHVFNLWHIEFPFRILSTSLEDRVATSPFLFDPIHSSFLKHIEDPHVFPGGSKFDDRGDLVQQAAAGGTQNSPWSRKALELRLSMEQAEFWRFEPVELDIEVRVRDGVDKTFHLPDTVDPGYDDFNIWIEEPSGERRRYRSPRYYCRNSGRLVVSKGQPFVRDVSIFGQAGSYTFDQAGSYRVQATWQLPDGRMLKSNRLELFVRPRLLKSSQYQNLAATLTRRDVALLLYHRSGSFKKQVLERVDALAAKTKDSKLKANLRYAISRHLAAKAMGAVASGRKNWQRQALTQIKRSLDLGERLSPRRRHHCQRLEEELEQL